MPPVDAAATMQVPDGFEVTVFAAEPDVRNPIACSWDSRGRLWIAENYTYERRRGVELPGDLHDRVLIFGDKDGDGTHDQRTVFTGGLHTLTSIEWSPAGLYLMCPPNLLFIPDGDRDDRPDGPTQVLLDGFTEPSANNHNFANGLRWGPDGWLYGRCGASAPGEVGIPGTPAADRIPLRGTMWRYHPRTRVFEALSCGCTNPWGHDWDRHGQLFFINTVNGHFWHQIPGAHYVRAHTIDPNPHAYQLLDHHADHWHFDTTGSWTKSRDGAANEFGGGHAHIGMIIYQGDNWPKEYRHSVYTVNMHGKRINREILERRGAGYVAKHAPDFLVAKDPFFRALELTTGPDGGVFLLDWSDTGECHENSGVHRTSGRIYKITAGKTRPEEASGLAKLWHPLVRDYCKQPNPWFHRMTTLEIRHETSADPKAAERWAAGFVSFKNPKRLTHLRLRDLFTLHQLDALPDRDLLELLDDHDEHLRATAIRLLTDHFPLDTVTSRRRDSGPAVIKAEKLAPLFATMARDDESALVRLTLASALQRFPVRLRKQIAAGLAARAEDAGDHNLPLIIWYGLIPVAAKHPSDLVEVASGCELPLVRKFIARRLAEDIESDPKPLDALLATSAGRPAAVQRDVLAGLADAFRGWQQAPAPASWARFAEVVASSADDRAQQHLRDIAVIFGDGRALDDVRQLALDGKAPLATRKAALRSLIKARHPDLRAICLELLGTRFLNSVAAEGLTLFDDPATAMRLANSYNRFHPHERPSAIDALASRPAFADALLDQIDNGKIPRDGLSAFHARQIRSFKDPDLITKLRRVWGELRDTPEDKKQLIDLLKNQLNPAALAEADLAHGRTVFNRVCANCHKLYGEGKAIGPDLTGSGRANLDYLLENIIDPGAEVSADFRMTVFEMNDGRILTGVVRSKDDKSITLQTFPDLKTIRKADVAKGVPANVSLMPDGILQYMEFKEQRDLIAYLMHPNQVPLR